MKRPERSRLSAGRVQALAFAKHKELDATDKRNNGVRRRYFPEIF